MSFLVGKPHNFILYRRAIARTHSVDKTGIFGRKIYIVSYYFVRFLVCIAEIAHSFGCVNLFAHHRKRIYIVLALLYFERGIINGGAVYTRGRSGFETTNFQSEMTEVIRKILGSGKTNRTAV